MNETNSGISFAVCVKAEVAQVVRKFLEENKLWDCSRKLQKDGDMVAVPVHRHDISMLSKLIQDFPGSEVKELSLPPSAKSVRSTEGQKLKVGKLTVGKLLRNKNLPEVLLQEVPRKWERHGDLVLLPASSFASQQWTLLGEELWKAIASVLSCCRLAKLSTVVNDGFRTPKVSMLLGHDGKVVHVDNGIKYSFDVTKCMFSSGNITEKLRVASWDCSKETVVDLYAGIGYFTLPYLVHAKACHVHACEWNPDAVEALRGSLSLNGVEDRCTVHQGDNRKLHLSNIADRVNLGLIPSSEDGWRVAARVLKPAGGVLHIHHNVNISSTSHTTDYKQETSKKHQGCLSTDVFYNEKSNDHSDIDDVTNSSREDTCACNCCHHIENNMVEYSGKCVNCYAETETGSDSDYADVELDRKQARYLPWARTVCKRMVCLLEEEKGLGSGWKCQILHIEKVKSYAPHIDHVVLDLDCRPKGEVS